MHANKLTLKTAKIKIHLFLTVGTISLYFYHQWEILTLQKKALTKQDHIDYWVKTANRDWHTVSSMLKTREYVPALFWSHLTLEKLFKAHWVKDNEENHPPKIHNLITLSSKIRVKLSEIDLEFLAIMNQFQMEGRYPDYLQGIYKNYKAKQTKKVIERITTLRKCLLKGLL